MKTLQIVDVKRRPIADVSWSPPNQLTVEVFDAKSEADLNLILERAKIQGIPYRTGGYVEQKSLMVDEQFTIGPEHEKFLEALSELVGQVKFNGERVFGLIKQKRSAEGSLLL